MGTPMARNFALTQPEIDLLKKLKKETKLSHSFIVRLGIKLVDEKIKNKKDLLKAVQGFIKSNSIK